MSNKYIGQRFGRLTVIREDGYYTSPSGRKEKLYLCKCDCGNETHRRISALKSNSKSCGCLRKEVASKSRKTHGLSNTRLYEVWLRMKERCYNKNVKEYNCYGGRGISVCEEWKNDFMSFRKWAFDNGYDENAKLGTCTLDRIEVNGNYEPSNCRWVSRKVQSKNTRKNIVIEYNGQKKILMDWAIDLGIPYGTLYQE